MTLRNLNYLFKELATKALGGRRGSELVFKDLWDSYNEAILDSDVNEEIKDILMGHLRESVKANYSLSFGTLVRVYKENIFPKLAVNGWRLKQEASKVDHLISEMDNLRKALSMVEGENTSYKTRVDNLQQEMVKLGEQSHKQSEKVDWIREAFTNISKAYDRMRHEYDVLQIWVNAMGYEALIKEYRELVKKFRMNWDE